MFGSGFDVWLIGMADRWRYERKLGLDVKVSCWGECGGFEFVLRC